MKNHLIFFISIYFLSESEKNEYLERVFLPLDIKIPFIFSYTCQDTLSNTWHKKKYTQKIKSDETNFSTPQNWT